MEKNTVEIYKEIFDFSKNTNDKSLESHNIHSIEESYASLTGDNLAGNIKYTGSTFLNIGTFFNTFLGMGNIFIGTIFFIIFLSMKNYLKIYMKNIRFMSTKYYREKYYNKFKEIENTPEGKIISNSLKQLVTEYREIQDEIKNIFSRIKIEYNEISSETSNEENLIKAYIYESKMLSHINTWPPFFKEIANFFYKDVTKNNNNKQTHLSRKSKTFELFWVVKTKFKSQEELDFLVENLNKELNKISYNQNRKMIIMTGAGVSLDFLENVSKVVTKYSPVRPSYNIFNKNFNHTVPINVSFVVRLSPKETEIYNKLIKISKGDK